MTTRGLTLGSFGILEVERGHQRFVVGGNGLAVLPEAGNITGCGVPGHCFGFGQGAAVSHAAGQRGHHGGESPLGFRPENNVEMVSRSLHGPSLHQIVCGFSIQVR